MADSAQRAPRSRWRANLFRITLPICAVVAVVGIVRPDALAGTAGAITAAAFHALDWFFMTVVSGFLVFCLWLAFGRHGKVRLGADDEKPEFSTVSWIAMLFAAGMGVGLLFWGVAEPVTHFSGALGTEAGTPRAARYATVITAFHWGLHAWAVYCVAALVLDRPSERIDAVLAGRADVAVVYATDGALRNGGITLLLDSLDFFPRYEAAWLIRHDALTHFAGLESALEQLEGKLDAGVVQELNYAAQIEGWKPANVARRFLVSHDMLQTRTGAPPGRLKLVLAVTEADELEQQRTRATRALRQVFPERAVEVRSSQEPAKLVAKGSAKLVLLGAEHFFEAQDGGFRRTLDLEAVAVVGSRMVHVLRAGPAPDDSSAEPDALAGRVGISPPDSGAGKIGQSLLATVAGAPAATAPVAELLAQLGQGSLDAALVVDELGAPSLRKAIEDGRVHLVSLPPKAREGGIPYLRPSRVPARTYAGQDESVETLAAQVVLAGPSRSSQRRPLHPGPGSALLMEASPLPIEEVRLLAEATGVAEWPDPVLPVAWTSWTAAGEPDTSSALLNTVLNVAVLAFLAWLAALVMRRPERSDSGGDGRTS